MTEPKNYKDTLNLPQTSFPMKANLAQREPEMLKSWEAEGVYAAIRAKSAGADKLPAWFAERQAEIVRREQLEVSKLVPPSPPPARSYFFFEVFALRRRGGV